MPGENSQQATVSKNALVVAVLISVVLTAVIVGSIVFAWQNSEDTEDTIFEQQLLETETESLEDQLDIVTGKE